MTEKEKRDAGLTYRSADAGLVCEVLSCHELCYEYNLLRPSQEREADALLRRILGRAGRNARFLQPFLCDYGYNISVGDDFFANMGCTVLDCAPVAFGSRVLVGPGCGFYAVGHPLDPEERRAGLEYARPITVGDDVWFGGGVTVVGGVTVGSGSVIGAGSVVVRDVPPGVLAAGNPCRVIRSIGPESRGGGCAGRKPSGESGGKG